MSQTVLVTLVVGLVSGFVGGFFQSIYRMREKKFELLFDFRKDVYAKLHKVTFVSDSFGVARYRWQNGGVQNGAVDFEKEFHKWLNPFKEFYETSSWAVAKSVYKKLEQMNSIADEIKTIFLSRRYEYTDMNLEEVVDKLWFRLCESGVEVRKAIQEDMSMSDIYKWT